MLAGVSTASLYPMHTEDALRTLGELGVKNTEVFINDISETGGERFSAIRCVKERYGMNVVSVHPFSSAMETMFLFSDYDRRRDTVMDMYRRYFDCMGGLGAKYFVLHGAALNSRCGDDLCIEIFMRLCDVAEEYGAVIVQENISYCRSCRFDFLQKLIDECGERAKFTLDIKQAVRSGVSPFELIDFLGSRIVHVHISDNREGADCLPVGGGTFDFPRLVEALGRVGYDGALLVELYRQNYSEYSELYDSMKKIEALL